jgi:DNA-binding LacI/PurR family transcriptional regulator
MQPASSSATDVMYRGYLAAVRARSVAPECVERLPDLMSAGVMDCQPQEFSLPLTKTPDWQPLGIMATSDSRANQLITAIGKTDLVLGRDIGVIGCFDLECGRASAVPPSTWTVDRHAVGAEAVAELITRIENPKLSRSIVRIAMEFMDRGTA